jgi:hypothetical protein
LFDVKPGLKSNVSFWPITAIHEQLQSAICCPSPMANFGQFQPLLTRNFAPCGIQSTSIEIPLER